MNWKQVEKKVDNYQHVLMLDNSTRRIHHTFKRCNKIGAIVTTSEKAIKLYNLENWDCIMLDYNLSRMWDLFHYRTSIKFAKRIAEDAPNSTVELVVIHSWNPWGRKRLYNLLKDSGIDIIVCRHKKMI